MAKTQSTPVEKAARLLDLVPFISTHQGIALNELAEEFNLSESELLSDLNTLWMCGLPGYTPLELIDLEFESGYVVGQKEMINTNGPPPTNDRRYLIHLYWNLFF